MRMMTKLEAEETTDTEIGLQTETGTVTMIATVTATAIATESVKETYRRSAPTGETTTIPAAAAGETIPMTGHTAVATLLLLRGAAIHLPFVPYAADSATALQDAAAATLRDTIVLPATQPHETAITTTAMQATETLDTEAEEATTTTTLETTGTAPKLPADHLSSLVQMLVPLTLAGAPKRACSLALIKTRGLETTAALAVATTAGVHQEVEEEDGVVQALEPTTAATVVTIANLATAVTRGATETKVVMNLTLAGHPNSLAPKMVQLAVPGGGTSILEAIAILLLKGTLADGEEMMLQTLHQEVPKQVEEATPALTLPVTIAILVAQVDGEMLLKGAVTETIQLLARMRAAGARAPKQTTLRLKRLEETVPRVFKEDGVGSSKSHRIEQAKRWVRAGCLPSNALSV